MVLAPSKLTNPFVSFSHEKNTGLHKSGYFISLLVFRIVIYLLLSRFDLAVVSSLLWFIFNALLMPTARAKKFRVRASRFPFLFQNAQAIQLTKRFPSIERRDPIHLPGTPSRRSLWIANFVIIRSYFKVMNSYCVHCNTVHVCL